MPRNGAARRLDETRNPECCIEAKGAAISRLESVAFRRRMSFLCQLKASGGAVAVDRDGPLGAAWSAGGDGGLEVGLEEVPDAAGEVAFEAADGFAAGLALGLAAGEVGGGLGVQAALGDGKA